MFISLSRLVPWLFANLFAAKAALFGSPATSRCSKSRFSSSKVVFAPSARSRTHSTSTINSPAIAIVIAIAARLSCKAIVTPAALITNVSSMLLLITPGCLAQYPQGASTAACLPRSGAENFCPPTFDSQRSFVWLDSLFSVGQFVFGARSLGYPIPKMSRKRFAIDMTQCRLNVRIYPSLSFIEWLLCN